MRRGTLSTAENRKTTQVPAPQKISSQPFTSSKYWQRCHWISTGDPRRYGDVASGHGDSPAVVPEDKSLHMLQQDVAGVNARMGQHKAQDVGLGGN